MIRLVAFDWGNVLVRYRPLGFISVAEALAAPLDDVVATVQEEGLFNDLLVGRADPIVLSARLADRFGRTLDHAQLVDCFAQDVAEPMPGMRELVQCILPGMPLGILSNTFFAHWAHLLQDPFYERFNHRLASHLIGFAKPDINAFKQLCERAGVSAAQVLYFDDDPGHVAAARGVGLVAHVFQGPEETTRLLRAHELLGLPASML